MKLMLMVSCWLFTLSAFCQASARVSILKQRVSLQAKTIYIFCRGTVSKSGLVAGKFNIRDSNITHVGLGFFEKNRAYIYHVTDAGSLNNALVTDSLESFLASPEVCFFSLWSLPHSNADFVSLKRVLNGFARRRIVFDASFRIRQDDTLYCSEFCVQALQRAVPRLHFRATILPLNNRLYQSILGRKNLVYYPADFFRANKDFRKIAEFTIRADENR